MVRIHVGQPISRLGMSFKSHSRWTGRNANPGVGPFSAIDRNGLATALWVLLVLGLAGCAAIPTTTTHDIPNFKPVAGNPGVYRGGQPSTTADWLFLLNDCGVSNVVKLNLDSEGSDETARALGMTVNYYPIEITHLISAKPSLLLLSNAVASIKPGTYIHCTHGQDRTGEVIGCLRVWKDGWSKTNAYSEMLTNGFHPILHGLSESWSEYVH